MGQRHQIYIKSNYEYKTKQTLNVFHNQWFYGKTPIVQLFQIIKYNKEASLYDNFSVGKHLDIASTSFLIEALYSVNVDFGYYGKMINLKSFKYKYLHPHSQDNNDGQTFIDFTSSKKPKICFSFPYDIEEKYINADTPITPLQYLSLYYETDLKKIKDKEELSDMKNMLKMIKFIKNNTTLISKEELKELYQDTNNSDIL